MNSWSSPAPLLLTCNRGCAEPLADELRDLGAPSPAVLAPDLVETTGDLALAMRLNLLSRIASRVLLRLGSFDAATPDDLYRGVRRLPWEDLLPLDAPFHWHGSVQGVDCDPRFAFLRAKDAVADRFSDRFSRRPDATSSPEGAACLALHWSDFRATVYLDTSGVSLSRRGWRLHPWAAPVRETLAAAILRLAGWNPDTPLVAPMCGSGTFAIEAALLARRLPPAPGRTDYAFLRLRLPPKARDAWRTLRHDALDAALPPDTPLPRPIVATDIAPDAIRATRDNARRVGVSRDISAGACDFRETPLPPAPACIVMNPEYGERLGNARALRPVYAAIGDWLKQRAAGMRAAVLSPAPPSPLARAVSLHPDHRIPLWNGPIECRLHIYSLYAGTRDPRLLRKHSPS